MPTRTYVKHFSGTTCEPTHPSSHGAEGPGRDWELGLAIAETVLLFNKSAWARARSWLKVAQEKAHLSIILTPQTCKAAPAPAPYLRLAVYAGQGWDLALWFYQRTGAVKDPSVGCSA